MARSWNSAYGVLFGLSFFGFPLISTIPVVLGVESRAISTAYRALVLGFSLLVLGLGLHRRHVRISGFAAGAFVALMLIILARLLWDSIYAALPLDLPWQDLWSFAVGVTLLPATVFCFVPTSSMLEACRRSALVIGGMSVIAILIVVAVSVEDFNALGRLATEVLNPISVGHVGVSLVIVCLANFATAGKLSLGSRGGAIAVFMLAFVGLAMVLASASKGPLLALMITLMLAIAFRGESTDRRLRVAARIFAATIAVAALTAALVVVNEFTVFPLVGRFSEFFNDPSTTVRTRIMSDALLQFNESPLFGSSTVEYHERFYPHNILVESLMVGGIPCFVALSAFLVCAVSAAIRIYKRLPRSRWVVLLFVQYVIDSMLSGSLYSSPTFWVTSLMVISAGNHPVAFSHTGIKFSGASREAT